MGCVAEEKGLGLDLMLVVAGAGTGLLVGLTGVGGGAVMTPLLLLGFGLTPLSAIGTDLWFAAFTKLVATRVHHGYGLIDWQVVRRLWWGSLPASAMTVAYINVRPIDGAAGGLLKGLIGCAVVLTALAMLFQQQLHELGRKLRIDSVERFKSMQPATTVAAGAILGLLVTLTSIGAGALGAVFLACLYPLRLTAPRLIAADIVHAIPLTMFAGTGHLLIGTVNFGVLGHLLIGSIPGVIAGSLLSAHLSHRLVRKVTSAVLLLTGLKLLQGVA
jgi:uncharacterized protein